MKNTVAGGILAMAALASAQSACLSLTSEFPPCAVSRDCIPIPYQTTLYTQPTYTNDSILASAAPPALSDAPTPPTWLVSPTIHNSYTLLTNRTGQCNAQSSAAIQGSALNCVLACGGDAVASALKAGSDICNWFVVHSSPTLSY